MSGATRWCGDRRPAVVGDNSNGYVETDPTGRYGRFDELLGKGAMKSVYRGFDEERGVEVAWNQASLCDVFRTPDAVQRMYSEVQLLSTLRHDAIIGFQASWVDVPRRTFNFITELFSSGTLRSFRLRYPRVSLRAVRCWARQILRGLAYLHAHDPPVIHRDLKCDNLFINGNQQGQVKIGDLGLAAVLREAGQTAHSVIGTPEFMAPEMYDEEYNELVDVYSFGMCMLEMLTVEFPYSECTNPAQIYKKVTAGKLPDAFYRVKDDDARRFIGRCLVAASKRPSAAELLQDPFLLDDHPSISPRRLPSDVPPFTSSSNVSTDDTLSDDGHQEERPAEEPTATARRSDNNMTITGKLNAEEDTIFLKVQIADETGQHVRNIYFPFDIESDTAIEVAREMVKELDITDRDASQIAAMIEQEIDRLLPITSREQHEYYANYDDDDENEEQPPPPPFYYLSSSPTSSSQGSRSHYGMGPSSSSGGFCGPHGSAWSKDHHSYYNAALSDDDDTSSLQSGKYSALPLHYVDTGLSGDEEADEAQQVLAEQEEGVLHGPSSISSKATRFGLRDHSSRSPSRRATELQSNKESGLLARQLQQQCRVSPHAGRPPLRDNDDDGDRREKRRMSRNRSMVDMRSQLLHRTLVEELNRRLFFNTVGAVENIGFRAPPGYDSSSSSASARGRGRRQSRDGDDSKNHRYYML